MQRLEIGPLVVGTLSSLDVIPPLAGDIIEVRLDKTGTPANWLERCREIEEQGKPVLLTVRLRDEGGEWPDDNESRFELYEAALDAVSAVDVELASAFGVRIAEEARAMGKVCILSHHDFEKTPPLPELEAIVGEAHKLGVAKVATKIRSAADVDVLKALLDPKWPKPLCVIGMGEEWKDTRIEFAKLGSCLTYGYLDKPTAPGQIHAAELVRKLRGN
jgi:3-dehydroquinate dehydratase I